MDARRASFSSTTSSTAAWDDQDDLIPTAVVIKNIPFAVKRDQLLDIMAKLGLPLPYAFNYHFDNGVFRGLAFANFNSPDETSLVVSVLNGREVGGRKLRVEYKKMLPPMERDRIEREKREKRGQLEEQHRNTSQTSLASLASVISAPVLSQIPTMLTTNNINANNTQYVILSTPSQAMAAPANVDLNNPEALEIYTKLVVFRDSVNSDYTDLAFSLATITASQRKIISSLVEYLGMLEYNQTTELIVRRFDNLQSNILSQQTSQLSQQSLQNQQPPSLIRSQSHNLVNSSLTSPSTLHATMATPGTGLTFQTSRLRQQPTQTNRNVSQSHQQPFNSLSSLAANPPTTLLQQPQNPPLLNHSSSTASLNLLRGYSGQNGGGLTAPATPNPSQARAAPNGSNWFNHPQLTGGSLANNTANTSSGLLGHVQLTGGSFTTNNPQLTGGSFTSNAPQLTGGSFSNVDDLFASLDNLTIGNNHIQL